MGMNGVGSRNFKQSSSRKTTNPSIGIGKCPPFSRVSVCQGAVVYAGAGDVSGDVRACQLPSSTVTPSRARVQLARTVPPTCGRERVPYMYSNTRRTFKGSVIWGVASSAFHTVLYCMFRSRHEPMFFFSYHASLSAGSSVCPSKGR